jgi:hypothetical protein
MRNMCPVPSFATQALISIESPKEEEGEREKRRRKKNIYRHLSHRPASLCREAKKKRYPYAEQKREKKQTYKTRNRNRKKNHQISRQPSKPRCTTHLHHLENAKKAAANQSTKKGKKEKTSRLCIVKPLPLDTPPNPPTIYCSVPPDCRYSVVVDNEVL